MKRILMASVFTGAFFAFSQNEIDVYRYSNTFVQGSARFDAMGGSFGALGAESGCIGINPAGFGRASVSSLSFGINGTHTKTKTYFNENNSDFSTFKMRVPNIAATIVSDVSSVNGGLIYTQISFGLNRVANFNQSFHYSGQQFESLLDVFVNNAHGISPDQLYDIQPYTSSLAYQAYAIDVDQNNFYSARLNAGDVIHNRSVLSSGGINEWYAAFSGNYLDRLYFGASISLNTLNYAESIIHKETLTDTSGVNLLSYTYQYDYKTKGTGTALKLGAIFLPSDFVRLGISIHTPTFYNLTDEYTANMQSVQKDGLYTVDPSLIPNDRYKYRIWTPTKMVGSFGLVIFEQGCLNVDLEYVNYRWGQLKSTKDQAYAPYDYKEENKIVKAQLVDALNIRVGGEWNIKSVFFIRAGYGFYPKGDNIARSYGQKFSQTISGGIGFRMNQLYLDLAVRYLTTSNVYYAFAESRTDINMMKTTFNASLQYKFGYK